MSSKPRRSILHRAKNDLIFGALLLVRFAGRFIPLVLARGIGGALGWLAGTLLQRERRKALRSISIAFPDLEESSASAIIDRMFHHLGRSLMEIFWMPNLRKENLERTTRFEGLDYLRDAVESGRGVVLFTGHCGNWEWMAAAIGLSGLPMNVIARDVYDPRINEVIVASRARHGVSTIGRGSASSAKEMLQTLRGGSILGVLIDQNIRAENAMVPFFGRPAPTPVGPARLAIRAGAMVITGFIERRGSLQHIRFEPPIETSRDHDPVGLTARITLSIEEQIRRVPDQWVWMHQRWKERSGR